MGKAQKKRRQAKQLGRLQEFAHQVTDHYEERLIGDEWYVKSFNGGTKRWQVAIYSKDSFRRYKSYTNNDNKKEFEYRVNKDEDMDINQANDMVDGNGDMIEINED